MNCEQKQAKSNSICRHDFIGKVIISTIDPSEKQHFSELNLDENLELNKFGCTFIIPMPFKSVRDYRGAIPL